MINNENKSILLNKKDLIKFVGALFLGSTLFAFAQYSNPPASGDTNVLPVYEDATAQTKNGTLAVYGPFIANGNVEFLGDVNFNRNVTGAGSSPVLNIGDATNSVNLITTGSFKTNTISVGDLKFSGSEIKPICADSAGKMIICPPAVPVLTLSYSTTSIYDQGSFIEYYGDIIWSATNATSCTSSDFYTNGNAISGASALSLSLYAPSFSQTMSMTCSGPEGSTTKSIMIHP